MRKKEGEEEPRETERKRKGTICVLEQFLPPSFFLAKIYRNSRTTEIIEIYVSKDVSSRVFESALARSFVYSFIRSSVR